MDDVWFGPGLTRDDLEGFLEALALHDKRPPLLAVAGGEEPRLVLASRGFFRLFDVATDQDLSDRLLGGQDPGAKRLGMLSRTLQADSAPRLERLRFLVGLGSEIITFLCRTITAKDGRRIFVAAALGVRSGLIPEAAPAEPTIAPAAPPPVEAQAPAPQPVATPEPAPTPTEGLGVQAIQATLRARYPSSRTVRFLWQSDSDMVCTQVTPPLADVVGLANADLVGRDLLELAPDLDPSGALGEALQRRETWSGLDVAWPITNEAAAVEVGLGAIPSFTRERTFDGYRGYGVIHLDRIVTRPVAQLPTRGEVKPRPMPPDNIVPFPGAKALSPEDQLAFATLGSELRDQAGIVAPTPPVPHEPEPVASEPPAPSITDGIPAVEPVAPEPAPAAPAPLMAEEPAPAETPAPAEAPAPVAAEPTDKAVHPPVDTSHAVDAPRAVDTSRAETVARNGLAMLDRLATGVLVSRDNIPIFANRYLLDLLGFADEDALHDAGGMAHLFGNQPGNTTGSEAIGVRGRDGTIVPANARMQSIEWDGLPATLLTLAQVSHRPVEPPKPAEPAPAPAMDVAQIAAVQEQIEETQRRHEQTLADVRRQHEETRQNDEGELRELRAILETATDGVAVIDAQCNVVSLNRSAEALFGHERGAVIGKPFTTLFAPHNQKLAADYFDGIKSNATQSLLNDGREFVVKAHQGTIPVFMTLGRLAPSTSEDTRFCALFRDLTHWKKVEQDLDSARLEAERSSALKTDFLAKVSHEIRTPLNAIIGFAEVIMEERFGPVGNERYKDYLRDIHASGTHVMSLVDDLLDLSKIEAGKMELAADVVDANKVIGECVSLMQPQASRERVIMRLSLAPTLPRIKADERSLRQIVLNLLSNAVKFNEAGGQVIVATATTETGQVVIRIRDTGPGMSESDIKAALEPFRQLSTSRPMVGGTGLGLPLTKALVEANEASFAIRSKVDQGTLVEVAFPPARVLAD